MKYKWIFLIIAVVSLNLMNSVNAQTARNATITGLVVDADSLNHVSLVHVLLLDAGKNTLLITVTDANGRFAFKNVSPGSYYLRTVKKGYKLMLSKMFKVTDVTKLYNYKLSIEKPENGEIDLTLDYNEYFELFEDLDVVNEK